MQCSLSAWIALPCSNCHGTLQSVISDTKVYFQYFINFSKE